MKKSIMKNKTKKGFTLVELLVTIFSATLFLTTLITALIFVQKLNKNLISTSSNMYKVRVVKNYILDNYNEGDSIRSDGDDVYYNDKVIASNTNIKNISIFDEELNADKYYTMCKIEYNDKTSKEFKFIIEAKKGD